MWYIYTMEYYSAIKKNETLPFAVTEMDLYIISKVSQEEKDKTMISLICGILKKMIRMNSFTKSKQTHRLRGKMGEGYIRSSGLTNTLLYIK